MAKDIHMCVDVHADDNGVLVWDNDNLPCSLKKLYFQNTQKNVTSIRNDFLYRCTGLTNVNLSLLSNVTSLGNRFLSGCKN